MHGIRTGLAEFAVQLFARRPVLHSYSAGLMPTSPRGMRRVAGGTVHS